MNASQQAILTYFESYPTYHPSAEEIYLYVKKQSPKIGMATIYRNLNRLVEAKYIAELNVEKQGVRYDYLTHEHFHFICVECGAIENFTLPTLDAIHEEVANHIEGQLISKDITFRGVCKNCMKKG